MLATHATISKARGMIGARLSYEGQNCTVIELLEDRLELILEADKPSLEIQTDAYGHARREMRSLYYVPLFNSERDELHPSFAKLAGLSITRVPPKF